jgi:hypothetical protein
MVLYPPLEEIFRFFIKAALLPEAHLLKLLQPICKPFCREKVSAQRI